MGDHIVRRGAAGRTRRSEPRPTAELTEEELRGLIHEHDREVLDRERKALEADLEIAVEPPRAPPAPPTPRMFAHTLRRAPSPDDAARGSNVPGAAPIDRSDISTIEMPRVERSAASDADPFAISDDEMTRQLRHRFEERRAFDEPVPPAEDDFEADCAILDLPLPAPPPTEMRPPPVAEDR